MHLKYYPRTVLTTSSIFRIDTTVSDANVIDDVETSSGCTTFSSKMLVMVPFRTLIPAATSPIIINYAVKFICKSKESISQFMSSLFKIFS